MDFAVSEKMKAILDLVNEFVERELIPLEPEFANKGFREMLPVIREKQKKVKQMELWAPNFPKDCGGMGLSLVDHGLLSEALGRSPWGILYSGAKPRMRAMWKSCICSDRRNKKKNISSRW